MAPLGRRVRVRVLRHKGGWGLRGERRASGTRSRAARPRAVSALSIASARARGRARICTHRGHREACWVAMARAAAGRASLAGASGRRAAAQRGRARRDRRLRRQRGLRSAQRGRARLSNLGFGIKMSLRRSVAIVRGGGLVVSNPIGDRVVPGSTPGRVVRGCCCCCAAAAAAAFSLTPHASRLTQIQLPSTQLFARRAAVFCVRASAWVRAPSSRRRSSRRIAPTLSAAWIWLGAW